MKVKSYLIMVLGLMMFSFNTFAVTDAECKARGPIRGNSLIERYVTGPYASPGVEDLGYYGVYSGCVYMSGIAVNSDGSNRLTWYPIYKFIPGESKPGRKPPLETEKPIETKPNNQGSATASDNKGVGNGTSGSLKPSNPNPASNSHASNTGGSGSSISSSSDPEPLFFNYSTFDYFMGPHKPSNPNPVSNSHSGDKVFTFTTPIPPKLPPDQVSSVELRNYMEEFFIYDKKCGDSCLDYFNTHRPIVTPLSCIDPNLGPSWNWSVTYEKCRSNDIAWFDSKGNFIDFKYQLTDKARHDIINHLQAEFFPQSQPQPKPEPKPEPKPVVNTSPSEPFFPEEITSDEIMHYMEEFFIYNKECGDSCLDYFDIHYPVFTPFNCLNLIPLPASSEKDCVSNDIAWFDKKGNFIKFKYRLTDKARHDIINHLKADFFPGSQSNPKGNSTSGHGSDGSGNGGGNTDGNGAAILQEVQSFHRDFNVLLNRDNSSAEGEGNIDTNGMNNSFNQGASDYESGLTSGIDGIINALDKYSPNLKGFGLPDGFYSGKGHCVPLDLSFNFDLSYFHYSSPVNLSTGKMCEFYDGYPRELLKLLIYILTAFVLFRLVKKALE